MANRLPLCGFELYLSPSNDLEKPMSDPAKKPHYPRNTKELPVSEAIEKLRQSWRDENAAIDKLRAEGVRKRGHILLRVPEVVRDHVATEGANLGPELTVTETAPAEAGQGDDDFADEVPAALREPVPPATGRIEVDRSAPRVGARRV